MTLFGLTQQQWGNIGISIAIFIGTALLARPVLTFILERVVKRITRATSSRLDDVLIQSLRGPLRWGVIAFAFQFSLERLPFLQERYAFDPGNLYFVFFLLVGFAAVWRLVVDLSGWYSTDIAPKTESDLDEQILPFLRRVGLIIVTLVALIILLDHFNVEVSGLVTTLGIGSLAVALAAQATLADTISGFMIMIDRPFRIGDRIELQDLTTWGDIVDIGLRSSRIRTLDNRMVIIPNSIMAKSLVVNHSFPNTQYRLQSEVGVAYGTDIELARQTLIDAVRTVEGVLEDKPVDALFLNFGDSALEFRVRWWLESYRDTRIMFDKVNTAVYKALNAAGIEIPFPQRDVHHKFSEQDIGPLAEALRE